MTTDTTGAVWIEGDPLHEAIAAAVYEQCGQASEQSLTVDDPRNIAAVAATVARRIVGPTEQADTEAAPAVNRAAEWCAAAEVIEQHAWNKGCDGVGCCADTPLAAAALLRRLAVEAQQPTPAPAEETK